MTLYRIRGTMDVTMLTRMLQDLHLEARGSYLDYEIYMNVSGDLVIDVKDATPHSNTARDWKDYLAVIE